MGYDHPIMSFVYSCVLLLVVVLALFILVGGGVTYASICGFLVDWVRLCFGVVC